MAKGLTRARNREEHRARVRARASLREAAVAKRDPGKQKAVWALRGEAAERFDQAKHPRGRGGKWAQGAGGKPLAAAPARGGAAAPVPANNETAAAPAAQGGGLQQPVFRAEGPKLYAAAFQRNRDFVRPGPYQTELKPKEETQFRAWLEKYQVPFNPQVQITDYDMRGYWKANQKATHKVGQHFPDTWKTPYDTTFSKESKYATPDCPFEWKGDVLIDERSGQVIFR